MTRVETPHSLEKTYEFPDFPGALSWMVQCSFVIENLWHHPEWTNVYNKVHVKLTTHDADETVTEKDMQLSQLLDHEYAQFLKEVDTNRE